LRTLIRLSRPLFILLAALTYCFGVSVAKYLGKPFRLDITDHLRAGENALLLEPFAPASVRIAVYGRAQ
jgi:hypothetical protein